jgi:uncharacterized protein YqeY
MSLEQRINEDIKSAMLAREKEKLDALRAIKSAILLLKTAEKNAEITEEVEINTLQKLAKQRRDAAELYKNQNREDLYKEEIHQLEIISQYLPEQLSEEDIAKTVKALIAENGISGMKDMGKLMGLASKAMAGKADNKVISEIVKKLLVF